MDVQSPAAAAPSGRDGRPLADGRRPSAPAGQKERSGRAVPPSGNGTGGGARTSRGGAPRKRRHPVRIALVAVLVAVVLLVGGAVAGFSWLHWFSEDDGADFTGTWYLAGTATPITITEDRIQLTDDVSYHYTLNDREKTFTLSFGNLKGGGRYRFSLDRNQLSLVDGDFSGADVLGDDLAWTARALVEAAQGRALAPGEEAKGVTLLTRTPTGAPKLPEATDTPEAPADDAKAEDGAKAGDGAKSGDTKSDGDDAKSGKTTSAASSAAADAGNADDRA